MESSVIGNIVFLFVCFYQSTGMSGFASYHQTYIKCLSANICPKICYGGYTFKGRGNAVWKAPKDANNNLTSGCLDRFIFTLN